MIKLSLLLGSALTGLYLVVQAPAPLPEKNVGPGATVAAEQMFRTVDAINTAARAIYTKQIVGAGKRVGLAFGEDWQDTGVDKGPLPALFLRLLASELERRPERLGLFLASDAPINPSNGLTGRQLDEYERVKQTRSPRFFAMDGFGGIAMFPDIASVDPCVTCHNDHKDSPRTDWRLGDVMGATTWTYPSQTLHENEYVEIVNATYDSVAAAYGRYLDKTRSFAEPPILGDGWPGGDMRQLPDVPTFIAAVRTQTSETVLSLMLDREGVYR
jgi:hypothetical protein